MEYRCECCNYNTKYKSNYDKHNRNNKHKYILMKTTHNECDNKILSETENKTKELDEVSRKLVKVSPELVKVSQKLVEIKKYKCKYCEKEYNHKSSLSKHIKYTCTKNQDEDLKELVRLLNLQLESERKDRENIQKQLQTQAKQIEKLMGKLEIHGSFNNNNNTINNITLLAYRDTDVSHLTTEDYIGFYKKVNHCVKQMIEKIHFNPAKPENMNIYISNMKDKYITIYDGSNWNLANRTEEIARLYEEKEMLLEEWLENNPNPVLKEKFLRYLKNKESDECLEHIMEEIKLMLYNKGNQLIKVDT